MKGRSILRGILVPIAFCGFTLLMSTCGGGRQPTFQSGAHDVLIWGKDTPETDLIQQRFQRT